MDVLLLIAVLLLIFALAGGVVFHPLVFLILLLALVFAFAGARR